MLSSASAIPLKALIFSTPSNNGVFLFFPHNFPKLQFHPLRITTSLYASSSSSSLTNGNSNNGTTLRHVSDDGDAGEAWIPSASAIVAAIRKASNSPVEFVQRVENGKKKKKGLVLPSHDFQRLCIEQLDLFRRIVNPNALLSVYVRPADSYVMDRLELRRVILYPGGSAADIVIVICNFSIPAGLRLAETDLSKEQAEFVPEYRAVVFPMVKHPFVVGFLVAELPNMELEGSENDVKRPSSEKSYDLSPYTDPKSWKIQPFKEKPWEMHKFSNEQILNAKNISRSLAMAHVMDQKEMLLQQSSWQNNVRMSNLVEQIRGPLSSIRTLSKMLSVHMKRTEISHDIVEDIMVQGDQIRDTLTQLQDAVYVTKANIVRYNNENLNMPPDMTITHPESSLRSQLSNSLSEDTSISKTQESDDGPFSLTSTPSDIELPPDMTITHPESSLRSQFSNSLSEDTSISKTQESDDGPFSLTSTPSDIELPMPPRALAPLQQKNLRPSNVSAVLSDLVGALQPLAIKQQRDVKFFELSRSVEVAIEEPALRQALSNLIEGSLLRTNVGGKVEIVSSAAPAGGVLVIIDDDGPDMRYMTQMHSLTPFGTDLLSKNMVEDNMTWNFVAGLTVAREILESYGSVIRVISPRNIDAALGTGGTRIELWLPSFSTSSASPSNS